MLDCPAIHEAGHIVVMDAAGIDITEAWVTPSGESCGAGHVTPGVWARATGDHPGELMMCAGLAAEQLAGRHPDEAERHAAGDLAGLARPPFNLTDPWLIAAYTAEARAILEDRYAMWQRLALLLAPGGTYGATVLRAVLDGAALEPRTMLAVLELRKAPA